MHPGSGEHLRKRFARSGLAIAGKGEAVLGARSIDHLARDDLEMAFLLPMPAAHVATIKPDHHRPTWWRRALRRRLGDVLAYDRLAHPPRPVPDRAGILCSTDRQQLRQQARHLAERRQRRIAGGDVGQLRGNRIMAEIQHAEALHIARLLTGTDEQASNPNRHITK
jgi:hypothetical protein